MATTIEYRVTYASGTSEQITVTARDDSAAIAAAVRAAKRYDRTSGKRDHITTVEFWERRS